MDDGRRGPTMNRMHCERTWVREEPKLYRKSASKGMLLDWLLTSPPQRESSPPLGFYIQHSA
jgi:hypothetical protein